MKYTVEVKRVSGESVADYLNCSRQEAMRIATQEASENKNNQVFVSWYRSSDGQRGYLNPDDNHAITGTAW